MLYRQSGDLLTVLFGLVPAVAAKEDQALNAIWPILGNARRTPPEDPLTTGAGLRPALGVASGAAIVGLDEATGAVCLQAVGAPLQVADELQRRAQPGEVLIDQATFEKAGALQDRFAALPDTSAQDAGRVYAYRKKTPT